MMSIKQKLTGKPSIDRPWMQYYPQEMIENLTVPNSTLKENIANKLRSFVFIITCILYIYWYFSSITSSVLNTLSF